MRTIGEYTYGAEGLLIREYGVGTNLIIGKFCSIASEVRIILGGEHRSDWITTYPFPRFWERPDIKGLPATKGDIVIGNDVWLGFGATILSGVTIGDGAVIGARSVISKDVGPYTIVAGNPAKLIRKRFDDQTIAKLLELKWWDWPIEKIRKSIDVLCSPNVKQLFFLNM